VNIRLHAIEAASRANGPGLRAVVWFQGCTLDCPGCFNPATHDPLGGFATDTVELAKQLIENPHGIDGVSFSGGEPLQQPDALLDLLQRVAGSKLGTLVFSGYTLAEIRQQTLGPTILQHLDVLIAGRYAQARHLGRGLLGSTNQQIHLLTNRYTPAAFQHIPTREIILHKDGTITFSGISPLNLEKIQPE
jgi:anaerobic ribonucleoside-triphosphate reductase activating protein